MRNAWLDLLDGILRPARPRLEHCLGERELHLRDRQLSAEARARAVADCERRINEARALVFALDDGVVGSRMTELEREWRRLSRRDPEAGLMELWARIAPVSSIDRKRWRDSAPAVQLDAVVALAADADGVDAAERAVDELRTALLALGTPVGSRTRWRLFEQDSEGAHGLLLEPLRLATEACPERHRALVLARAERVERHLHDAALARFPHRPGLARELSRAAFVDAVWSAASMPDLPNPVTALRALWRTGYVISQIDAASVILELPPLARAAD